MERQRLDIQGQLILLDYQILEQKRLKDRYETLWKKNLESLEEYDSCNSEIFW